MSGAVKDAIEQNGYKARFFKAPGILALLWRTESKKAARDLEHRLALEGESTDPANRREKPERPQVYFPSAQPFFDEAGDFNPFDPVRNPWT